MVVYNDPVWGRSQVIGSRTTGPRYRSSRFIRNRTLGSTARTASIANKVVLNNQEKSYFETPFPTAFTTVASINDITLIPQGDTDTNRRGDKLKLLSLKWNGEFILAPVANVPLNGLVRIIFFQWHPDTTYRIPLVGDILSGAATFSSHYNHDQGSNYSIFYDRSFIVSQNTSLAKIVRGRISFKKKKGMMKFVKRTIKYDAATTSGSDHIFVLAIADNNAGNGINAPIRIIYTDS